MTQDDNTLRHDAVEHTLAPRPSTSRSIVQPLFCQKIVDQETGQVCGRRLPVALSVARGYIICPRCGYHQFVDIGRSNGAASTPLVTEEPPYDVD